MSEAVSQQPAVQKGLEGVVAAETRISEVDGQRCELIYQGYHIDELVSRASFEEVSFLLLHGALPNRNQLQEWTAQLGANRALSPQILSLVQSLPHQSPSMALLRTVISAMGLYDPDEEHNGPDLVRHRATEVIAQIPTIIAAGARRRAGKSYVPPQAGLSHAANFLYMLHGQEPSELQAKALDAYLVLLADHGLNASTFAARVVTGTQSDYYSAIVAAIGTLKGPLHGAANRKAMEMLIEIGSVDRVDTFVKHTLAHHQRFMGFGHRVYKGEDPRAKHLKRLAQEVGDASGERQWLAISERLKDAVWSAKQLYVNVDFYSASLLHCLGIPTELFTTMFACARVSGWSAHILEQLADNRLIRPLSRYTGPRDLKLVPLEQRA